MWTQEEISSLLSDQMGQDNKRTMAELFCSYYGVEKGGNVKPHQVSHLCALSPCQNHYPYLYRLLVVVVYCN